MLSSGQEGPDCLVAVCRRLAYLPLGRACCFLELFGDVGVMDSADGLRYTLTHSGGNLRNVLHGLLNYISNYIPDCGDSLCSSVQHIEDQSNASAGERPNYKTLPYVLH